MGRSTCRRCREPSGAIANAGHPMTPRSERPLPQRSRRIAQWMYGAGSAAMVLLAVIVWQTTGSMPTSAPSPMVEQPAATAPMPTRSCDSTGRVGTGSTAARPGDVRRAFAPAGAGDGTPAPRPPGAVATAVHRTSARAARVEDHHHGPRAQAADRRTVPSCRRSCRPRAQRHRDGLNLATTRDHRAAAGSRRPASLTLRLGSNQSSAAVTMAIDAARQQAEPRQVSSTQRRWDGTS